MSLEEQIDANLNEGIEDENLAIYLLEQASKELKQLRKEMRSCYTRKELNRILTIVALGE